MEDFHANKLKKIDLNNSYIQTLINAADYIIGSYSSWYNHHFTWVATNDFLYITDEKLKEKL